MAFTYLAIWKMYHERTKMDQGDPYKDCCNSPEEKQKWLRLDLSAQMDLGVRFEHILEKVSIGFIDELHMEQKGKKRKSKF